MSLDTHGFELQENFLNEAELAELSDELANISLPQSSGGIRNAQLKFSVIKALIQSKKLLNCVEGHLGARPNFVRAILCNKTEQNNWLVTWHQDKTLCLATKKEIAGWGPWSLKDGLHHVQPPQQALDETVSVRIHLDDSTPETGCLRVIPGSHVNGILSNEKILDLAESLAAVDCLAPAGSILLMRPLLIHASSKATKPSQRRVLHIEYSSYQLPEGLCWVQ